MFLYVRFKSLFLTQKKTILLIIKIALIKKVRSNSNEEIKGLIRSFAQYISKKSKIKCKEKIEELLLNINVVDYKSKSHI